MKDPIDMKDSMDISSLSTDLLANVLSFCEPNDWLVAMKICKAWRQTVLSPTFAREARLLPGQRPDVVYLVAGWVESDNVTAEAVARARNSDAEAGDERQVIFDRQMKLTGHPWPPQADTKHYVFRDLATAQRYAAARCTVQMTDGARAFTAEPVIVQVRLLNLVKFEPITLAEGSETFVMNTHGQGFWHARGQKLSCGLPNRPILEIEAAEVVRADYYQLRPVMSHEVQNAEDTKCSIM